MNPGANNPQAASERPTVRLTEVGPRDGLQNESTIISPADKIRFINLLSACGFDEIEVSSFVSPKWVPQLGDAAEVFASIERKPGVTYSALVPNEKGLDAAFDARVDKIAVFTAASETFSLKNTNASIAQTLARFKPVIDRARQAGVPVRAYISCAVACPYEGPVAPVKVRELAIQLLDLGADEIDLGDTIGAAWPDDISRLLAGLNDVLAPGAATLHLHDTHHRAVACAERGFKLGVRSFDSSCAGLGGCPYAPGAAGNVSSEALIQALKKSGAAPGVDAERLRAAAEFITGVISRLR